MEVVFLLNGKTKEKYLQDGVEIFEDRIKHYIRYKSVIIPDLKNTKNLSISQQKQKEAEAMLPHLEMADIIILLDEKGTSFRSTEFADFLQIQMNKGIKNLLFIVGGPFGFAPCIYEKAHYKISLSSMTFSHQMIRLLFTEQLYRAFSILKGEAYHNE